MAKGWRPACETLRQIDPAERQHPTRGTSRWWTVEVHSDGKGGLCPGSGKKI